MVEVDCKINLQKSQNANHIGLQTSSWSMEATHNIITKKKTWNFMEILMVGLVNLEIDRHYNNFFQKLWNYFLTHFRAV